ncbi:polymorphic toxin-type HINT domain-containing protein, partial [Streptomyces meridianus]
ADKRRAIAAAREIAQIAADELGITDALDCFTTGALGACGATFVNLATSFVGGMVGKLAAKYGMPWKWAKAVALGKKLWNLAGKLIDGLKGWWKNSKIAQRFAKSCSIANSFVPGTRVLMADGSTKAIEDVDIGDKVVATDPETGETKVETVTAEIKGKGAKKLVKVTIDIDGDKGSKTASVTATDGHPFWVPELGEWIDATDLKTGEWLRTSAGTHVQITAIKRWTAQSATVHNLTVSNLHTYYALAGATPVLVHNCNNAATHEVDNLVDNLDDDVYFHYTSEDGHAGILSGDGSIRIGANSAGKVHVTQEIGSAVEIERNVMINNPSHAGKADFLFAFRMPQGVELGPGSQPNELIARGSLKIPAGNVLFHGRNPF